MRYCYFLLQSFCPSSSLFVSCFTSLQTLQRRSWKHQYRTGAVGFRFLVSVFQFQWIFFIVIMCNYIRDDPNRAEHVGAPTSALRQARYPSRPLTPVLSLSLRLCVDGRVLALFERDGVGSDICCCPTWRCVAYITLQRGGWWMTSSSNTHSHVLNILSHLCVVFKETLQGRLSRPWTGSVCYTDAASTVRRLERSAVYRRVQSGRVSKVRLQSSVRRVWCWIQYRLFSLRLKSDVIGYMMVWSRGLETDVCGNVCELILKTHSVISHLHRWTLMLWAQVQVKEPHL